MDQQQKLVGWCRGMMLTPCVHTLRLNHRPWTTRFVASKNDSTMGRTSGWSARAHLWLDYVKCSEGLDIQHVHNGKEVLWVDME